MAGDIELETDIKRLTRNFKFNTFGDDILFEYAGETRIAADDFPILSVFGKQDKQLAGRTDGDGFVAEEANLKAIDSGKVVQTEGHRSVDTSCEMEPRRRCVCRAVIDHAVGESGVGHRAVVVIGLVVVGKRNKLLYAYGRFAEKQVAVFS